MKISRMFATLTLGTLAVAVVAASFLLTRSPEPDLVSDPVSVSASSEAAPVVDTPAPGPAPQAPAGDPRSRAIAPNLVSDDWCDDDDHDDDRDDRDDCDDWDDDRDDDDDGDDRDDDDDDDWDDDRDD